MTTKECNPFVQHAQDLSFHFFFFFLLHVSHIDLKLSDEQIDSGSLKPMGANGSGEIPLQKKDMGNDHSAYYLFIPWFLVMSWCWRGGCQNHLWRLSLPHPS